MTDFLAKLKNLCGMDEPENLDDLIIHLEIMAEKIRKNEQEVRFLFYELENQRKDPNSQAAIAYKVLSNSNAPQLIINSLSMFAFEEPKANEKEQKDEEPRSFFRRLFG